VDNLRKTCHSLPTLIFGNSKKKKHTHIGLVIVKSTEHVKSKTVKFKNVSEK